MLALADKHLPGQGYSETTLATALYLERDYWKSHEASTANAICLAFKDG